MKIILYKEYLPNWIISSNIAAYQPNGRIIHISKRGNILNVFICICHEIGHYLIDLLDGLEITHRKYDLLYKRIKDTIYEKVKSNNDEK